MVASPLFNLCERVAESMRVRRLRTMREFAEQEIVIPTGPFAGLRFLCTRNPFSRLWFAEMEKGWRRFVATGPTQSGKTLQCFVIPILYHLFEVGEDVILAAPSMDIAVDKWLRDILPVIKSTRYRDQLPRNGVGSKGGKSNLVLIEFKNGKVLRFMTGGGDDKSRSNFTSRVVAITETDGLDEISEGSREADKITQLEARTQAFGDRARIYMECTVSTEEGRTWREYTGGSESRIAVRCPHCRKHVSPEREHLTGWDAEDEIKAGESAAFACPECGAQWTEAERVAANHDCLLVHKGQEITPDGEIVGGKPRTDTLGFRWSAVNNLLTTTAVIGKNEWKAKRSANEDNAEKGMLQFWWAKPYAPASVNLTSLDPITITKRATQDPRGRVPADAGRVTIGIDLGKYLCHWTAVAWRPYASPHVIEYGRLEVATNDLGEERAILAALRQFRDTADQGWPADDGSRKPAAVLIDEGWNQDVVVKFCEESPGFYTAKGFGAKQIHRTRKVGEVTEAGLTVIGVFDGYEILWRQGLKTRVVHAQADRWKSWLHARISTPIGQPGALTIHQGNEHLSFAKHLTAEKKIEEFVAGRGLVVRWEVVNRNNHFLDSTCLACLAGHAEGERLIGEAKPVPPPVKPESTISPREWIDGGKRW